MSEILNKIQSNIKQHSTNLDNLQILSGLNLFSSPVTPHQINYYQSPTQFINYNTPSMNDEYYDYSNNENQPTNFNINSFSQTPKMNLIFDNNNNNNHQSNKNIETYKSSEKMSYETDESSIKSGINEVNIITNIENIVCTANLNCSLNLREIALQAKNAEYNPKRFSALITKIREPKSTCLIFSSGKIVCLGTKNEENSKKACRKFAKIIKSLGYNATFKDYKIQNVVGSADVKFQISLMKLYCYLLKNTSIKNKTLVAYEPEQFPGLIYSMIEPNIVVLIFVSGKIVLTGGKSRNDIYEGFKKIYPVLVKFKIENILKDNKDLHQNNIKEMKKLI